MCDACVMHTCTGVVGPKTGKVKKVLVFKSIFEGSRKPGGAQEGLRSSEPDHSRVTLEPLWGHFGHIRVTLGHFMITLGSLWNHFGCMRVDFQKTFIFPIDFNDFIKHWASFGVALGSLWGHFGATLGPLLVYESNFWGISGSL